MLPAGGPSRAVDHAVIVVGGGPTGLMLAGELALARVDVAIVERRTTQTLIGARAGGLHSRTLEILDQRGIVERFLARGEVAQVAGFSQIRLDISDFPSRHPYGLALWQNQIESVLADWISELGVCVYRGRAVTGAAQDGRGVEVQLGDGKRLRGEYVVGCDGGRSVIRKAAGIAFSGWDPTTSYLIAEVEMAVGTGRTPSLGIRHDALGVHSLSTLEDGRTLRVMVTERRLESAGEPTLHDLQEAVAAVYGTDYGIHSPAWISRFTDAARLAATYRDRRILLAGDAAHVHHPIGGQGLNTGVQDAVNLGWKLAQVVKKTSPDTLLDSYHAERHPVGARVLRNSIAQMALLRPDDRTKALRDIMSDLLAMDQPRTEFAAMMSGLDIHYDLGAGHPLLGRRMPDVELVTAQGSVRTCTLLHDARAMLLNLGESDAVDITAWRDHVRLINAKYVGKWELPAIGVVTPPGAVLIRPDGHVGWVGEAADPTLVDSLIAWCGPPAAS